MHARTPFTHTYTRLSAWWVGRTQHLLIHGVEGTIKTQHSCRSVNILNDVKIAGLIRAFVRGISSLFSVYVIRMGGGY